MISLSRSIHFFYFLKLIKDYLFSIIYVITKSEVQTEYFCKKCNKFYASASSLCNHNKKFHKNEGLVGVLYKKIKKKRKYIIVITVIKYLMIKVININIIKYVKKK